MEVAIKTGLLVYAAGPGPKQRRFWCSPPPQTKAINPQRWQWGNRHEQDRISIKKQKEEEEEEEARAATEGEMLPRFSGATAVVNLTINVFTDFILNEPINY